MCAPVSAMDAAVFEDVAVRIGGATYTLRVRRRDDYVDANALSRQAGPAFNGYVKAAAPPPLPPRCPPVRGGPRPVPPARLPPRRRPPGGRPPLPAHRAEGRGVRALGAGVPPHGRREDRHPQGPAHLGAPPRRPPRRRLALPRPGGLRLRRLRPPAPPRGPPPLPARARVQGPPRPPRRTPASSRGAPWARPAPPSPGTR